MTTATTDCHSSSLTDEYNAIHELKKLRNIKLKIFQIHSIKNMHFFITNTLPKLCNIDNISIQHIQNSAKKGGYFTPLNSVPEHFLCFSKKSAYKKGEKRFLRHISESIDSNLQKIETWERLQSLKEEWKSTFNAIPQPICLTDQDFNILSTNKAFLRHTGQMKNNIHRKNCFAIFFGKALSTQEEKSLLKSSILKSCTQKNMIFELRCQTLKHNRKGSIQIIIFTDRTEKIQMEKKISRMADSAEMGIITSSIAHELNNPLAGIQALLQIAQQEPPSSIHQQRLLAKEQISEMLSAVQRCQQIIYQLLKHHSSPNLKFLKVEKTKV